MEGNYLIRSSEAAGKIIMEERERSTSGEEAKGARGKAGGSKVSG